MILDKSQQNKGQIMVEAMIAITIAVVGLLGIFSLLSRSLSLNRVAASQIIGINLAAEGIELVKNLIDANVIQNKPFNNGSCLTQGNHIIDYNDDLNSSCFYDDRFIKFDSGVGLYSYDAGEDTPYKRIIIIEWPSADEIKVNSSVNWTARGGAKFDINLEDHFYNWR
jgi:hypothetical protein